MDYMHVTKNSYANVTCKSYLKIMKFDMHIGHKKFPKFLVISQIIFPYLLHCTTKLGKPVMKTARAFFYTFGLHGSEAVRGAEKYVFRTVVILVFRTDCGHSKRHWKQRVFLIASLVFLWPPNK